QLLGGLGGLGLGLGGLGLLGRRRLLRLRLREGGTGTLGTLGTLGDGGGALGLRGTGGGGELRQGLQGDDLLVSQLIDVAERLSCGQGARKGVGKVRVGKGGDVFGDLEIHGGLQGQQEQVENLDRLCRDRGTASGGKNPLCNTRRQVG